MEESLEAQEYFNYRENEYFQKIGETNTSDILITRNKYDKDILLLSYGSRIIETTQKGITHTLFEKNILLDVIKTSKYLQ